MRTNKGLLLLAFCLSLLTAAQSQTTSAPAENSFGSTLRLADVVRMALATNPAVESASHMVEAQRRKVPQARALPDPQVGIGWMGNATPFSVQRGDPSSYRSVSAMQMLPFPGKLKLRSQMAGKDVEAAGADLDAARRQLVSRVKAAFFDYFYYGKALEIASKDKDLLQRLSSISDARYRVGRAMQQDVLKSQTEITLLMQKIKVLERQRATAQARLNTLLSRPPEAELPPAELAGLGPAPASLQELYGKAEQHNPMLVRDQRMIERSQIAVQSARREYRPDLTVGFMYQQRPDMPDMKGATFTVNIPVFYRNKQREGIKQAEEEVAVASKAREERLNQTRYDLRQAYLSATAARELAELYSKAVVPQATLALESSMSSYSAGTSDFLTVFSNFSTLLNYEMDYYRQVADYNMALADMESMSGVEMAASSDPAADPFAAKIEQSQPSSVEGSITEGNTTPPATGNSGHQHSSAGAPAAPAKGEK